MGSSPGQVGNVYGLSQIGIYSRHRSKLRFNQRGMHKAIEYRQHYTKKIRSPFPVRPLAARKSWKGWPAWENGPMGSTLVTCGCTMSLRRPKCGYDTNISPTLCPIHPPPTRDKDSNMFNPPSLAITNSTKIYWKLNIINTPPPPIFTL